MTSTKTNNNDYPESDFGQNVHVSSHPVLSHKLTILRSSTTPTGTFRAVMKEITYHLGYEATRSLLTKPIAISVPVPKPEKEEHLDYEGRKLSERVALVPKMRSGLGMIDGMMELLPNATVHHIGMYKADGQKTPVMYFNRLPRKCQSEVAYILDPVIATSSSVMSLIRILKKWGVPKIHVVSVIGSRTGIKHIVEECPDVSITLATIDETVAENGLLLPGLGDAGDRLFGTAPVFEDDESLLHPSKRKRATSQD